MPEVHLVASLLKRWLLGTHQGAVSHEQLDYYLDEFTFPLHRRRSRHRGLLFYRLLEQAVSTSPHPYRALTAEHVPCQGNETDRVGIGVWLSLLARL
jgi:hypothetical protein